VPGSHELGTMRQWGSGCKAAEGGKCKKQGGEPRKLSRGKNAEKFEKEARRGQEMVGRPYLNQRREWNKGISRRVRSRGKGSGEERKSEKVARRGRTVKGRKIQKGGEKDLSLIYPEKFVNMY